MAAHEPRSEADSATESKVEGTTEETSQAQSGTSSEAKSGVKSEVKSGTTAGATSGTSSAKQASGMTGEQETASEQTRRVRRPAGKSAAQRALELRGPIINLISGIVRWIGVIFAVVLVVAIILTIGQANPDNGITVFIGNFASAVSIGFKDLFAPQDPNLAILVNYGIAAIFWLVVTAIIARILRRFG